MKLFAKIARAIDALGRCRESGNDYADQWETDLAAMADGLPSGSGFDSGTRIDADNSTGEKVVITTAYHGMNEDGMYDRWNEYQITVLPSLVHGFTLKIKGPKQDREYVAETMAEALDADVE